MSIANIGTTNYDSFNAAIGALASGQTLFVNEDSSGQGAVGTLTNVGNAKILGVRKKDGSLPKLAVDKSVRLAWQKGVINIQAVYGLTEIGRLDISGAYFDDSTGAAIRLNGDAKGDVLLHHLRAHDNQNGILTADGAVNLWIFNSEMRGNGLYVKDDMKGYTHDAYIGALARVEAIRSSFIGSPHGHEFKSRAVVTVLRQCLCADSAEARALDIPNGGTLLAFDSIFRAQANAGQRNLADFGAEYKADEFKAAKRENVVIIFNGRFHSDVPIDKDVQFFFNRLDVTAYLIDPQFTGAASEKDLTSTVVGKVKIIKTGAVLGPRVPDSEIGGNPDVELPLPTLKPTTVPTIPKDISEATPVATVPATAGTTPVASGAMTISLTPELMALAAKLVSSPAVSTPSPVDSLGAEFANMVTDALSDRTRKSTITVTITPDGIATKVTHPK